MKWQLQHAKARLSEVIRRAREEGPQIITVHGKEEFVLMKREGVTANHAELPPAPEDPLLGWDAAFAPVRALDFDLTASHGGATTLRSVDLVEKPAKRKPQ